MELHVEIKLDQEGFPASKDMDIRDKLEDLLDERVGEVTGAGGGMGVADLWVEVEDEDVARKEIQTLLEELGIDSVTTVTRE